ncbi:MAG: C25 family cysteine peptidase [Candidatus Heimdallarchaeota archaeon]
MKKSTKVLIIIIITIAFVGVTVPFTLFNFSRSSNPTPPTSVHVRIYVNSTLYSSLSSEISQYNQDVIAQGYTTELINWSNTNVTVLRNDLINASNQPRGLKGAVLIGDLPSATMRYYDNFWFIWRNYPIELYLTDLDGQWVDLDPSDDLFDAHNNGTGDIYPEIWIGRICPETLNNTNHLQAYQNYFTRNHAYRVNQLNRPNSQLVYIDDDWSPWTSEWLGDMTAYTNITCVSVNSNTTATDYKNRLTHLYEFVHVFVHSWPYEHLFGPSGYGAEGKVNYTDILNIDTQALFYNLFACSAANFEYRNNLGTQYLFSNNTLVVIGSSKIGGMTMNSYFYTPLSQGKTFGEAMRVWYWNPLHGPSDPDSMGMTILGDPLLTILM